MAILTYALRRAAQGVVLVLTVVILIFLMIQLAPGDPITALVGDYPHTPEYEQAMREKFGLDASLGEQLLRYMTAMTRLDFGYSFRYQAPVSEVVVARLGATVMLMGGAMLIAAVLGLTIGVLSSLRPYSIFDNIGTVVSLVGYSIPVFWLGQILILIFAIRLGWLPAQGMYSIREDQVGLQRSLDLLTHLLLPVIVLSMRYLAINGRTTRASMLEVLNQDYITTARAKGLRERTVIIKHAFRNALIPVVTVIGVNLGFMLTGSVLTETVFGWPGIGLLTYDAINARDYPILLAVFMMVSIVVITAQLITDIAYALLDPRIRY